MESHAEHVQALKITCAPMLQCILNENGVTVIISPHPTRDYTMPSSHVRSVSATLTLALHNTQQN